MQAVRQLAGHAQAERGELIDGDAAVGIRLTPGSAAE
jgi:hypothetical protein